MQECESGLRESNRRERLSVIHEAAYRLAREGGPASVTIDAISERAGVSRRTFFNYFASKEDAILGLTPLHIPDDARAAFVEAPTDEALARVAHLLLAIVRTGRLGTVMTSVERRDLLDRFPDLLLRHKTHQHAAQELVLEALNELEHADGALTPDEIERGRVLVLTSGMALRLASDRDPQKLDGLGPAEVDAAVARIRTILKEL